MRRLATRVADGAMGFAGPLNGLLVLGIVAFTVLRADEAGQIRLASGSVSAQVRDILWFALLCGLASFSTIEVLKRLTGIRGFYQLRQTMNWLEGRYRNEPGRGRRVPVGMATPENHPAFFELLSVMGVRGIAERNRVFDLPTEQLAAQINTGVDSALVAPDRYPGLMAALLGAQSDLLDAFKRQAEGAAERPRSDIRSTFRRQAQIPAASEPEGRARQLPGCGQSPRCGRPPPD